MPFYRIDRRQFQVGDIITPNAAFINNIGADRLIVEELLEAHRPANKPNRNQILKLFESKEEAIRYWVLDPNSKFYEVELLENEEILHRGNYNFVEQIKREANQQNKITIVNDYWNEVIIEGNIIENFVNQARVIDVVSDDEEERKNTQRHIYKYQTKPGVRIIE
jgi:hypothetical protein